ncbi:MAG: hypothetical protein H6865_07735 [Rhodospirillales bacterium]|nr:hypothetical protein [Alphaproteobacteria bacterium]MCB9987506.1 hypothetical protein [Rhodospirillales bacterium]USO07520.1 MAG: hypothetical protein H6866_08920 [Rhodospirillales bacterium]
MKHPTLLALFAVIFGFAAAAWLDHASVARAGDAQDTQESMPSSAAIARSQGFTIMPNGTILYEEIPAEGETSLENIAPAAGGPDGEAPRFIYDPLTQTYRRTIVDRNGNSGQDVINTNTR